MKMTKYDPKEIEAKWQKEWEKSLIYATPEPSKNCPKKYVLDMFPYPSGSGLHVGHMEGYVGTDVVSRYYRMKGFSVLHPMGWDAFGLPAENYAIKEGIHPDKSTHDNIDNFRHQLKLLGLSYDWDRELDTSSPDYYKWTQWLFIQLFNKGLAYKKKAPANWCPKDETVLANEQVVDGKCERCGTEVVQKDLDQWFFKITAYADRLIDGLDKIDWLPEVKTQQINWIGKKEGLIIHHKVKDMNLVLDAFTAYPAWIWADTFFVVSPEHPVIADLVKDTDHEEVVSDFVENFKKNHVGKTKTKPDEKEGVFTGRFVLDPITGRELPVWLANFALMDFGTGMIRCSCHDPRDFEFATKYKISLQEVVARGLSGNVSAHENKGILINSGPFDGRGVVEVIPDVCDWVVKGGFGERTTTLHIRDWLISRQRYWGCPIPMIYCPSCAKASAGKENAGWQAVSESELPVLLPTDVDFRPTGESPIARSTEFQKGVKCPKCGGPAKRETDTMDGFGDNSWYFIRFVDPDNKKEFASKEAMKSWLPVDIYVGGGHVVQHLLYSRFFYKVLFDNGLIPAECGDEPFLFLRAPGWILGPDSRKMSKRWGNIITPEQVVNEHGADTMRTYEMFMAPFEVDKPWNTGSVAGVRRFLDRIWRLYEKNVSNLDEKADDEVAFATNKLVNKVGGDIEKFRFNTGVAAMMEYLNVVEDKKMDQEIWEKFMKVLAPYAPHLAEELWQQLQGSGVRGQGSVTKEKFDSVHKQKWPEVSSEATQEEVVIAVSVNGKVRSTMKFSAQEAKVLDQTRVELAAKSDSRVEKYLSGQTIKRTVYVPGKIVNFVI